MAAGYSATPLAAKLGIRPGHRVATVDQPDDFRALLVDLPENVTFQVGIHGTPDVVVAFYVDSAQLVDDLAAIGRAVFPDCSAWIAWPKKTSGVDTDLTGDVVRAAVLETQLVDVKVCAISEIWSGLKVVWRKEARTA